MTKLTDLQYVLLAIASKRGNGSLMPPSTSIGMTQASITRVINTLIKRSLAEEVATKDEASVWRAEGKRKLAIVITDAGRAAIAEADDQRWEAEQPPTEPEPDPVEVAPQTKQARLIAMLQRKEGATLDQLVEATGWLPHTTRAALTGLRKKGHVITRSKDEAGSCYHIVGAA
jgi:DNA-binding MarR family transcriptional regulator